MPAHRAYVSAVGQFQFSVDMPAFHTGPAGREPPVRLYHELALIAGLVFMLWRKIITWHIPISIITTVFVFSALLHLANPIYADPTTVILSGGLMLGAIFMATDYVTSPMTPKGQLIYGISIGILTVIIRNWGAYPEGMSFAILIMNAFTPLINNYVKPVRFGETPNNKAS